MEYLLDLEGRKLVTFCSIFLPDDVVFVTGHLEVWNLFPYPTCEGVPILRRLRPMHREL